MSWKRADPAARARRHAMLGGRSITAHSALLFTLSAGTLLAIVVGTLYWVESRGKEREDRHFLSERVQRLRLALRHEPDSTLLEHEVNAAGGVHAPAQMMTFYSRILDQNRRVLLETSGAEKVLPVELFPPPVSDNEFPGRVMAAKGANGRDYLLVSAWAQSAGAEPERRIVQVAFDNSPGKEAMAEYRRASLLLVAIGVLLSAYAGMLVARSGMRPLGYMAQLAGQVGAGRHHARMEAGRWPRELAALATAFDAMSNRLQEAHSRQSQFSANLAHELRTYVHGLMGQTEIVLSKENPPEEYRRVLESNLEEYERLARTMNGLLFLARAEDPKSRIERSSHDARGELEAIREFHEALAEDRGVSVTCKGQADLYADPVLFRRAVSNLLSNALRHTPRGGQIVLSAEQTEDQGTLVRVSDTGCGIADKDMPRLCDRLHFPVQGTPRRADGTGLGLAIVKSIAELHSGTVNVQSSRGQGTVVTLHFPNPALAAA